MVAAGSYKVEEAFFGGGMFGVAFVLDDLLEGEEFGEFYEGLFLSKVGACIITRNVPFDWRGGIDGVVLNADIINLLFLL